MSLFSFIGWLRRRRGGGGAPTPPPPPAPVAKFTASPTSGVAPCPVQFTSTSSGSPTVYLWTFGDGGTSALQNPLHTYAVAGLYSPSLHVESPYGQSTKTKANYVNIGNTPPPPPPPPPPEVDFVGSPRSGALPFDVAFSDASTNTPTAWAWQFGDGGTSTLQNPTHTYTTPRDKDVTLTATNAGGPGALTKTAYITPNRMTISGTQIYDEAGNVFVPRGLGVGHELLVASGDEAYSASIGSNIRRIVLRWWGDWISYRVDSESDADPGHLNSTVWAANLAQIVATRAAGMKVHLAFDSNCGQGAGVGGVCDLGHGTVDFASNTAESNAKLTKYIEMIVWVVGQTIGQVDSIEGLVEPAGHFTQASYWDFAERVMNAVLPVDPHMIFYWGGYPIYQAVDTGNALRPGWNDVGSPYRNHCVATYNMLSGLASNAALRADRFANYILPARIALNAPVVTQQTGTTTADDPDDHFLDDTLTLHDQAVGGPVGYMVWEDTSVYPNDYGLKSLTDPNNGNSARVLKTARRDVLQRHFTGAAAPNTWLARRLLATNMGPGYDFSTRVYVNALHQSRGFGTLADTYVSVPLKSDGYPQAGQTCICYFLTRMDASEAGEYLFECLGDETDLVNAGDGSLTNLVFDGTKTTCKITTVGAAASIGIRFNSVSGIFGGVKLHPPGYPLNTTKVYRDEALHHFGMFRQIRFMDWQETNGPETGGGGNQDTDWATSRAANWASASGYKHSLKACFDFCAAIDADPYTNVPARFTDAAIFSYVQAGLGYLPAGRTWYIEIPANEPWNGDFQQYSDLRAAAYAQGQVRAGTDISSLSRTSNVITAGVGAGHGVSVGGQVYVRQKNSLFTAGLQTVTATTSSTISWASTGSNGAIAHADDDTFIYLDPTNVLVAPVTTYYTADQWAIAVQVKGRYEISRARRGWLSADSLGMADRVRIVCGVWMDNYFNSVDAIAWAAEQYGDMTWLYGMTPALYLRPSNPAACTTVDLVFTQLEAARTAILPRALLWGNLMRSWGMHLIAYEGLQHTHDFGGHTAIFVAAHQDDRMRVLNKAFLQDWLNRGGEGMYAFFSGWRREMLSGLDSWVDVVGDFSTGDTQAKHKAWVELKDETAVAAPISTQTSGTIAYVDVIASGYQATANGQLVIRPTLKIEPTTIVIAVPTDGTYTVAIDAGTDTATVSATLLIDGVAHDVGNLPIVASVFSGAHPGEALSATLTLAAGTHDVAVQLPAPTRAGWVALYRVRVT